MTALQPWYIASRLAPFLLMLLAVGTLPLLAPHAWERHRNRAALATLLGLPVALQLRQEHPTALAHAAAEYLQFMAILVSLYVITSHLVVRGSWPATPRHNVALLALGGILASCIGTTGASMLLVRPLLRSNATRPQRAHVMVFFIFVVSNMGGLLTPLGDPPLYLGFLRGVPFTWTLQLWPQWLGSLIYLLTLFYLLEVFYQRRAVAPPVSHQPIRVEGGRNFGLLAVVVGVIGVAGVVALPAWLPPLTMLLCAALAWRGPTAAALRQANTFSWDPVLEVGTVFAGIFATMPPALLLLEAHGTTMLQHYGITQPQQFFWLTGLLSSFLDNAPTYLTATASASSLIGSEAQHLARLAHDVRGAALLRAISCGAVMMGANTYLGNGPNMMVQAISQTHGTKLPSFGRYMLYAAVVLGPLFALLSYSF